jgi:hypothetical protein
MDQGYVGAQPWKKLLVVPCRATTVLEICINMNFRDCGQDSRKGNGYLTRASHAAA